MITVKFWLLSLCHTDNSILACAHSIKYIIPVYTSMHIAIINPRRMRHRVMVVILCVCICLSVTTKSATYLVYASKIRYMCIIGFFTVFSRLFVVWLSFLKTLRSKVLPTTTAFLTSWQALGRQKGQQQGQLIGTTQANSNTSTTAENWPIVVKIITSQAKPPSS